MMNFGVFAMTETVFYGKNLGIACMKTIMQPKAGGAREARPTG